MDQVEKELRNLWTRQGVPVERQDALIRGIEQKAQPGAMVGPFMIPFSLSLATDDPKPKRGKPFHRDLFSGQAWEIKTNRNFK